MIIYQMTVVITRMTSSRNKNKKIIALCSGNNIYISYKYALFEKGIIFKSNRS